MWSNTCLADAALAAAGSWVRDGLNLRLEIGICSIGDPDYSVAAGPDVAAAAVAPGVEHSGATASRQVTQEAAGGQGGDHGHHQHTISPPALEAGQAAAASDDVDGAVGDRSSKRRRTNSQQQQQQQEVQEVQEDLPVDRLPAGKGQQQPQAVSLPDQRLDIIAASAIAGGCEVHNTYGELSNPELVHKYGFCLPHNPFDEVQLGPDWPWLLEEVGGTELTKHLALHVKWLQQHRQGVSGMRVLLAGAAAVVTSNASRSCWSE